VTVRPVLSIGHPTLRVRSTAVPREQIASPDIQGLVDDLIDTMRAANGAGLAANQIGATHRIAVIEVDDNPRYPYKPRIPLTVAINPEIEALDDESVSINEGCLSVPLRGEVDRRVNIRVRYLDRHGESHVLVARGLTAGTWQHESDHLDGVLFVDRVADPTTLSTWEQFEAHHRDEFVRRITAFAERIDS
jgi:peptide deformylase